MAISDRGFASMSKEKRREISRRGGLASGASRASNSSKRGAAGSTAAGKRGGQRSSR